MQGANGEGKKIRGDSTLVLTDDALRVKIHLVYMLNLSILFSAKQLS